MSFLDKLNAEEKDKIISLPYRIGLMVSQSDAAGDEEANDVELQALSNILNGFTEDVFSSETVQHIMSATIAHQDHWDKWGQNLDSVARDCASALFIMRQYVDEQDVVAFRRELMEIGEAVAMAFHEYNHRASLTTKLIMMFFYSGTQIKSSLTRKPMRSFGEYVSISIPERKALKLIATALGTKYGGYA